jgi:hypothetical protein
LGGLSAPALALDGQQQAPANAKAPLPLFKSPQQAQKQGLDLFKAGNVAASVDALKYAADGGQQIAQWQLGRMYASGEGVGRDDVKAYRYFEQIVDNYNEDEPDQWDIRFVANAFVAIGVYSLTGVTNSNIKRDVDKAFEMFQYAAMNFGDSEAQFNLARMYLDGTGVRRDATQATKWLSVAAEKNHMESQALLGHLLFTGEAGRPRQRARGLMLLTLARDAATGSKKDAWIIDYYKADMDAANELDREMALKYLDGHLKGALVAQQRR